LELRFNDPNLKFKGLIVKFLPSGKLLVVPEGSGFHYTLHPGHQSGVPDLHRTNEGLPSTDTSRHETLAAIPQEEIVRNLSAVGKEPFMDLIGLLRPIRIGWIARRRLGIVAFPTETELSSISGIRVKKASPSEFSEPLKSWVRVPEFIDDILQIPNSAFLLFDCRKDTSPPYGVLFKVDLSQGVSSLCWIKLRDLRRWSARMELLLAELFSRLGYNLPLPE
jgi:hypothetical protein